MSHIIISKDQTNRHPAPKLQSFNASAFEGNQKLCGAPLPNTCLPIEGNNAENENNHDNVENGQRNQIPYMVPYFRCSCLLGSLQDFEEFVDLFGVYRLFFSLCGGDFLRVHVC